MGSVRLYLALLSVMPFMASAQFADDFELELEDSVVVTSPTINQQIQANPVQIQTIKQVQKQPVTYIEAAPVGESKADQMRKARQETELQTELRIVEKLEQSRIEDEKERAARLFGDRMDNLSSQQQQVQVVQEQPVTVIKEDNSEVIRNEIRAALSESAQVEDSSTSTTYFMGMVGLPEFQNAINVRGNGAFGVGIGARQNERLLGELSFMYAAFEKAYYYYTNTTIDQYSVIGSAKYQLMSGLLRPVIGAALAYNYRVFNDRYFYYSSNSPTSNSFDIGYILGVDVELNRTATLGVEYRAMRNMSNKTSGAYPRLLPGEQTLDSLGHYVLSVNGKFTF